MTSIYKALVLGLLTGVLGLVINLIIFQLVFKENIDVNLLFKLRGARKAPHDVIVVSMDKFSADKLNLPYNPKKWPRSIHAHLTENLVRAGAKVIAFDIMFRGKSSTKDDILFAETIRNAGNVVLCESIQKEISHLTDVDGGHIGNLNIERLEKPLPALTQSAFALAPFLVPKEPRKVSKYWTFKTSAGNIPTLPVVVFQTFALSVYDEFVQLLKKHQPPQMDKLMYNKDEVINTKCVVEVIQTIKDIFDNDTQIAQKMLKELQDSKISHVDVRKERIIKSLISMYQSPKSQYLNFYGPPHSITTIPYYHALQFRKQLVVNQNQIDLSGKVVFVGSSENLSSEQKDGFYTVYSQTGELDTSGVEIAATAFANLLEDGHIKPLGFYGYLGIFIIWGMILGILSYLFPPITSALCVVVLSLLYLIITIYQFKYNNIWYPLIVPLFCQAPLAFFASRLFKYFQSNKKRRNIRKAFRYNLPDQIVDQLPNGIIDLKTRKKLVYSTCLYTKTEQNSFLFSDMEPRKPKRQLKKHNEALCTQIKNHGGSVTNSNKDYTQAIWVSVDSENDRRKQACLAALDIIRSIHRFNQSSHAKPIQARIGLFSEQILLGNIDAIDHYEYHSIDDIVSIATRIEELNKSLGTRILLSNNVIEKLDFFLTRELGRFILPRRPEPVTVHELLCLKEESSQQQRNLCISFSEALDSFKKQSWKEANAKFNELIKRYGKDSPSLFYAKLCKQYRNKSFEVSWNGLVCMDKNSWTI